MGLAVVIGARFQPSAISAVPRQSTASFAGIAAADLWQRIESPLSPRDRRKSSTSKIGIL